MRPIRRHFTRFRFVVSRVDIFVGSSTGLYGARGCDVMISMIDDAREPGVTLDLSGGAWVAEGLIRRQLDDLIMSASVNYRLFDGLDPPGWPRPRKRRARLVGQLTGVRDSCASAYPRAGLETDTSLRFLYRVDRGLRAGWS